ncbi:MAG: HEPN domain-containing protein [Planctomycetes bacterium]|nr:HEPN domain-containing protein [Planctomycetota bacterium]
MRKNTASAEILRAILAKAQEKLSAAEREFAAGFFGEASSRAYYAVFHALTAALAAKGLSFSSHAQVIGAFNREFVKPGLFPPDTTKKLQRLFQDRQTADYDWVNSVEAQTAAEDVADAKALVAACQDFVSKHIQGHAT